MKLKDNFVLRQVADTWVVLPLGEETINFSGMLKLNESGSMLWRVLEQNGNRDALVEALTAEYDVSRQQAEADIDEFLSQLSRHGCMHEE